MSITVLGPLTVNGTDIKGRRDRIVLAVLGQPAGAAVPTDTVADALWGDEPPPSAAKNLQGCVVRLRRLLGPEAIATTTLGYSLEVPARRGRRLAVRTPREPGPRAARPRRARPGVVPARRGARPVARAPVPRPGVVAPGRAGGASARGAAARGRGAEGPGRARRGPGGRGARDVPDAGARGTTAGTAVGAPGAGSVPSGAAGRGVAHDPPAQGGPLPAAGHRPEPGRDGSGAGGAAAGSQPGRAGADGRRPRSVPVAGPEGVRRRGRRLVLRPRARTWQPAWRSWGSSACWPWPGRPARGSRHCCALGSARRSGPADIVWSPSRQGRDRWRPWPSCTGPSRGRCSWSTRPRRSSPSARTTKSGGIFLDSLVDEAERRTVLVALRADRPLRRRPALRVQPSGGTRSLPRRRPRRGRAALDHRDPGTPGRPAGRARPRRPPGRGGRPGSGCAAAAVPRAARDVAAPRRSHAHCRRLPGLRRHPGSRRASRRNSSTRPWTPKNAPTCAT